VGRSPSRPLQKLRGVRVGLEQLRGPQRTADAMRTANERATSNNETRRQPAAPRWAKPFVQRPCRRRTVGPLSRSQESSCRVSTTRTWSGSAERAFSYWARRGAASGWWWWGARRASGPRAARRGPPCRCGSGGAPPPLKAAAGAPAGWQLVVTGARGAACSAHPPRIHGYRNMRRPATHHARRPSRRTAPPSLTRTEIWQRPRRGTRRAPAAPPRATRRSARATPSTCLRAAPTPPACAASRRRPAPRASCRLAA
jgi:hypothetical protein